MLFVLLFKKKKNTKNLSRMLSLSLFLFLSSTDTQTEDDHGHSKKAHTRNWSPSTLILSFLASTTGINNTPSVWYLVTAVRADEYMSQS